MSVVARRESDVWARYSHWVNKHRRWVFAAPAMIFIALLLIFPHQSDDPNFIDVWSWVLFAVTLVASARKVNPILLIVLSAVAGIAIYA